MKKGIGKIYYAFVDFDYLEGVEYSVAQYFETENLLQRYLLLNTKDTNELMFLGPDKKFYMISLLYVSISHQICGILRISILQYIPI
jgi:hypothetical protein